MRIPYSYIISLYLSHSTLFQRSKGRYKTLPQRFPLSQCSLVKTRILLTEERVERESDYVTREYLRERRITSVFVLYYSERGVVKGITHYS